MAFSNLDVEIDLIRTESEMNALIKTQVTPYTRVYGVLRSSTSILNPIVDIELKETEIVSGETIITVPQYNYAYIPNFHRFYFIDDIVSINSILWEFHFSVDVLNSWHSEILASTATVARCESALYKNEFLIDDKLYTTNKKNYTIMQLSTPQGYQEFSNNIATTAHNYVVTVAATQPILTTPESRETNSPSYGITKPSSAALGCNDMINKYAVTYGELYDFIKEIFNGNFINNIQKLFDNPISNVLSIMAYPFDVKSLVFPYAVSDSNIVVNTVTLQNSTGCSFTYVPPPVMNIARVEIPYILGDFTDYSPYTQIQLYLPFVGFVDLNPAEIIGRTIIIQYAVDFNTGNATAFVVWRRNDEDPDRDLLLLSRECQLGIPIPINGTNGIAMIKNMIGAGNSFLNAATGAVGGAVGSSQWAEHARPASKSYAKSRAMTSAVTGSVGLLSSTINATIEGATVPVVRGGSGESFTSMYAPMKPYLIITRPDIVSITNYAHDVGYPCMKTLTLSSLSGTGFVQVSNIHLNGGTVSTADFNKCTKWERDEIERLLINGVIF